MHTYARVCTPADIHADIGARAHASTHLRAADVKALLPDAHGRRLGLELRHAQLMVQTLERHGLHVGDKPAATEFQDVGKDRVNGGGMEAHKTRCGYGRPY